MIYPIINWDQRWPLMCTSVSWSYAHYSNVWLSTLAVFSTFIFFWRTVIVILFSVWAWRLHPLFLSQCWHWESVKRYVPKKEKERKNLSNGPLDIDRAQVDLSLSFSALSSCFGNFSIFFQLSDALTLLPGTVIPMLEAVLEVVPIEKLAVHFHDTYGQALSNILISLQVIYLPFKLPFCIQM